jgi:bleomycin hydrolase
MIKRLFVLFLSVAGFLPLIAQGPAPDLYQFKETKRLEATPVKNQEMTGTCWAFSSSSFLESEAERLGKGVQNISEMYTVRHIYHQKCENFVRRQGDARFDEGGLAHDLLNAVQAYGMATESAYPGRKDPSRPYNHSELTKSLRAMCDGFVKAGKAGALQDNWLSKIDSVLDAEFGPVPASFVVDGKSMTPVQYRDYLGIRPDDYVTVTSFTHHPFYSKFILEIPDNFSNGSFYNLPLEELMDCLNNSIQQGYTVEWDADVSNRGFAAGKALALVPEKEWKEKTKEEQNNTFKYREPEKKITQAYRQLMFDRQVTQDDHLMHITGTADEAGGGRFYIVKNSWGEISDLKGYLYISEAYMQLNTISFMIHKDALPAAIRQKLGITPAASTKH